MHLALRARHAKASQGGKVSFIEDVGVYLRFFISAFTVGFLISGSVFLIVGLIIAFFMGAWAFAIGSILKFWVITMLVGLPFGMIVWLVLRLPLRFVGVPEIGSGLFASIPSLLTGLHFGLTLSDAKGLVWDHLVTRASQDVSELWWIYAIGALMAPFFAMRAMNE